MNWFLITILPIGIVLGVLMGHKRRMRRAGSNAKLDGRIVALTFVTTLSSVVFAETARVALSQTAPHLIWIMIVSAVATLISSNALVAHEHRMRAASQDVPR